MVGLTLIEVNLAIFMLDDVLGLNRWIFSYLPQSYLRYKTHNDCPEISQESMTMWEWDLLQRNDQKSGSGAADRMMQ
jgi:hypothetical protein